MIQRAWASIPDSPITVGRQRVLRVCDTTDSATNAVLPTLG